MKRPYDSERWRKARAWFLAQNPLCAYCARMGRDKGATAVDHIKPWKEGKTAAERYQLFWDSENWQPLCASCHSGVKRMEDLHGYSQACGVDGLPLDPRHPWSRKR